MTTAPATHYYVNECSVDDFRLDGIRKLLMPRVRNTDVLELGLGTGHFTRALAATGHHVTAADIDSKLLETLRPQIPQAQFVEADLNNPETIPQGRFRTVIAIDILEHIEQDTQLLQSIAERQRTGDQLLVLVPIHPRLYSHHDRAIGHVRRYTVKELLSKVRHAGYEVTWFRRWNVLGYLAAVVRPGAGTHMVNDQLVVSPLLKRGPVAQGLRWWLRNIESRVRLGQGLSCVLEARRL